MIESVTCGRCGGVIEVPSEPGNAACECGLTYVRRRTDGVSWGGPGSPIVKEIEHESKAHRPTV